MFPYGIYKIAASSFFKLLTSRHNTRSALFLNEGENFTLNIGEVIPVVVWLFHTIASSIPELVTLQVPSRKGCGEMPIFIPKGTDTNLERFTTDRGIDFRFNTGHAYREHRTGPDSHPQRAGTRDIVEESIIQQIQQLIASAVELPELKPGIKPLNQIVTVNGIKIEYRVGTVAGVVRISDYWALP